MYAPLRVHSNHSFLEGASFPGELVERAHALGLPALALTDRDSVGGVVRAHTRAREIGLKLLIGATMTVDDGSTLGLLASSRAGYAQLCRLITRGRRRCPKGASQVTWPEICAHAEGLIALWGGAESLLQRPDFEDAAAGPLREAFGDRLYAHALRHRRPAEVDAEAHLRQRARRLGLPVVAGREIRYHTTARRRLQDVLTCIRHGLTLPTAGRLLAPNAQHGLLSGEEFDALFADDPAAVERSLEIAARCDFSMDELRYVYPSERLPDGRTSADHLRHLSHEGARERYGEVPPAVRAQIDRELALIEELDYCGYFLTMHEIVCFCRQQGILCQGRGSAANSVVCFALHITNVDPTRIQLLFERFLSRERAEPPDIDLDIMHSRREEVIQHVYAKYGRDHAAMVANVIRYRARSALRDVGKALGLPATGLDQMARGLTGWDSLRPQTLRESGLDPQAPGYAHLLDLVHQIQDFPRHLSIHPGGFLLGHQPVHDLVPIENASMENRTVIQWDKYDVEALGLFKVDLLGLGALSLMDRAFELLAAHKDLHLGMADLPQDDPATYDLCCRADTVGVFQLESRAQMSMLPRLRPRRFYDLVIEVSIVRPGPITGGMVHPYLRRRRGEEPVSFPHPCLRPVLEKTLGVPLFQEQVMRLAMVAADYSPGEADELRRDMAAWRSAGRIEDHRDRLVSRMIAKGIEPDFARRVFEQIRGFGEYGFPESHAASFALIAYATAWMRTHHPAVFTCAVLDAQPMGFYSVATLVDDAKRRGVVMLPVDVRASDWRCRLEPVGGGYLGVRMGLRFLKGVREDEGRRVEASDRRWPTLGAFVRDTRVGDQTLRRLGECGALRMFGLGRRATLWAGEGAVREATSSLPLETREASPDFARLGAGERIAWDYAAAAHSTLGHPLAPLRGALVARGLPDAATVQRMPAGRLTRYAGLVICRQRPSTAAGVVFMTLEDETGFVNLVIWADVWARYRLVAGREVLLGVRGQVQREAGVVHLIARRLWAPELEAPARPRSRDFH